jgi:hypothetical protein
MAHLTEREDFPLILGMGAIFVIVVAMIPLACQEEQHAKLTPTEQRELTEFAAKRDNTIKIVDPLNHELHDLDTPEGQGSLKMMAEMAASDAGEAVVSIQNNGAAHLLDTSHPPQQPGAKAWVEYTDNFSTMRAYVLAKPEGHGAADIDHIYLVQPDGGTVMVSYVDRVGWTFPVVTPGVTVSADGVFLDVAQTSKVRGITLEQPKGTPAAVSRGGDAKFTGNRWFGVGLKP